jgi:NTP pyrophosphatase (non-canonical NTP hydrolase)
VITERQREVLVIAQEEAAEVIQEISKIYRFGIDDQHRDGMTHREKLQNEVGDLLCMIDLMVENRLIDPTAVEIARQAKVSKLRRYSKIYQ